MQKNLAGSWLLRGGHISPSPLIKPKQIPFVGDLQPPGGLPQAAGSLPPTVENWPIAAGAPPEKIRKIQ